MTIPGTHRTRTYGGAPRWAACLRWLLAGLAGPLAAAENPPSPQAAENPLPWEAALDPHGELPTFAQICFDDFDRRQSLPQPDDLKQWFTAAPDGPFNARPSPSPSGVCAEFDGLARLKMPWRENVALRLALQRFTHLRFHFWSGNEGVTLVYYEEDLDAWAAYVTTRQPGKARPETFALAATDQGRAWRSELRRGETFELRWHERELLLSRGDIVLLRAPCEKLPDEVYLEGKALFHGIAAVRSQPPPSAAVPAADEAGAPLKRPADYPWTPKLGSGAKFQPHADGTVELTAEKAERNGWVTTPLSNTALQMVTLELDNPTPGTGIFFGRADGAPQEILRFASDRRSGRLCVTVREDDVAEWDFVTKAERVIPYTAPRPWIRMLFGCGVVRWWLSCDGVHWAVPEAQCGSRTGNVTALGLHHIGNRADCRLRVRQLHIQELPTLTSLASAAARERAKPIIDSAHIGSWVTRVTELQPADVPLDEWRRACAIRSLAAGCPRELANAIIGLLEDDVAARGEPLAKQLALLNENGALVDTRDDWAGLPGYFQRYHELATRAYEQRGERPFSLIRPIMMSMPLASPQQLRVPREETIRLELLQLAEQYRWGELQEFCQQLRYFHLQENLPLYTWATWLTGRYVSVRRPRRAGPAVLQDDWRHPLVEEVSRETYNMLAELRVALDGGSLDDATRQVVTLDAGAVRGLAPGADDRQLLVSLPTVVRMTLESHPELRDRIHERYGRTALLRVQQAIREGNSPAIELATIQYAGSEAAAEAHRWLGDRALASGWFAAALSHYRLAAGAANAALLKELAPSVRLASALLGRPVGQAVAAQVKVGPITVPGADFETLLAELLKRGPADAVAAATADVRLTAPPRPTGFNLGRRLPWDGNFGKEPTAEIVPNISRFKVDWVSRQLATVVDSGTLYISNRFQVAAYDLATAQRKWQAQLTPETSLRAQDWGLSRMRPLVTGQRVFARLLYQPGPQLVCLDKQTGAVLWSTDAGNQRSFVSDPVLVQGQLLVLTLAQLDPDVNQLQLGVVDTVSGHVLQQRELLRLNDVWLRRRYCEMVPTEDSVIFTLGGVTGCCDVSGNLQWLRKQTLLPPTEEAQWVTQDYDRALLAGNAAYVAQPGSRAVQRVAVTTGRAAWTTVLPTLQRVVGLAGKLVIAQTDEGLVALEEATGVIRWKHAATELLQAVLCGDAGIVYGQRVLVEEGKPGFRVQLVWLDPETGRPSGAARLAGLEDPDPRLGPLVTHQDRVWAGFGRGVDPAKREWIELTPQGPAEKPELDLRQFDVWLKHISPRLLSAMVKKLGGWRLLCGEPVGPQIAEAERWGRRDVPGTRSRAGLPVILSRRVTVPNDGETKLRITVANEPAQEWQLTIRLGGQPVTTKEITAAAFPQPWKTIEIDLSGQAGQNAWLTIEAQFLRGGAQADLFWDGLEIVSR